METSAQKRKLFLLRNDQYYVERRLGALQLITVTPLSFAQNNEVKIIEENVASLHVPGINSGIGDFPLNENGGIPGIKLLVDNSSNAVPAAISKPSTWGLLSIYEPLLALNSFSQTTIVMSPDVGLQIRTSLYQNSTFKYLKKTVDFDEKVHTINKISHAWSVIDCLYNLAKEGNLCVDDNGEVLLLAKDKPPCPVISVQFNTQFNTQYLAGSPATCIEHIYNTVMVYVITDWL